MPLHPPEEGSSGQFSLSLLYAVSRTCSPLDAQREGVLLWSSGKPVRDFWPLEIQYTKTRCRQLELMGLETHTRLQVFSRFIHLLNSHVKLFGSIRLPVTILLEYHGMVLQKRSGGDQISFQCLSDTL